MSKLMLIFGILFLAAGLALGLLIQFQPGQMQVLALTPEVAAILLVGGAVCVGLGNITGAIREYSQRSVAGAAAMEVALAEPATEPSAMPKFKGFRNRPAVATAEPAETAAVVTTSVAETISALEQAKSDIAIALGVEAHTIEPAVMPKVEPAREVMREIEPEVAAVEPEPELGEAELYVVEEKVIRGRPARVLSDGTVEAETDEGWMRFENLEHLDEYLEAMAPEK